jgi:U3 small nucleolar RNA-associated protein 12
MIEQFTIDLEDRDAECQRMRRFDHPGHRSDVRTVSFSSDNTAILSGSHESVKVWNRGAQVCIRTIFTGYCLCSFFVPGD